MSDAVLETALMNPNVFSNIYIHCLMMGDELFLKRSPDKNQRLVIINGIYHVRFSARNSLDEPEGIQQFIFTA